jgi:hypothetical protein
VLEFNKSSNSKELVSSLKSPIVLKFCVGADQVEGIYNLSLVKDNFDKLFL